VNEDNDISSPATDEMAVRPDNRHELQRKWKSKGLKVLADVFSGSLTSVKRNGLFPSRPLLSDRISTALPAPRARSFEKQKTRIHIELSNPKWSIFDDQVGSATKYGRSSVGSLHGLIEWKGGCEALQRLVLTRRVGSLLETVEYAFDKTASP
jgi:hypothetical protein